MPSVLGQRGRRHPAADRAGADRPPRRRGRRRVRAAAVPGAQGDRARGAGASSSTSSTCPRCPRTHASSTRGCSSRPSLPPSTPTCATRATRRRSPSSTSATAPTPSRPGTLAQPFRMLAHNGEINTLAGQPELDARPRAGAGRADAWGERASTSCSRSSSRAARLGRLDNVLELLELSGRDVRHALTMLVPEAWENMPDMDPARRAFYEYHACLTEPWDGPAALAFTDGVVVGACARPQRPAPGALQGHRRRAGGRRLRGRAWSTIDDGHVVEKGRLGPGQMIAVDTAAAAAAHATTRSRTSSPRGQPYGEWLAAPASCQLDDYARSAARLARAAEHAARASPRLQHAFGYTHEELQFILEPMASDGKEPVGSMGDDTPLAVLSRHAAAALRLLQAALRPGHQPADRPAARGAGDVARHLPRAGGAACSRRRRSTPAWSTSRARS